MSHRKAKKTPQAFADLRQAARYLTLQQNERLATRFAASAEVTFQKLAAMPSLGAFLDTTLLKAPGIRTWTVKGFERYVIIYREIAGGIEVLRVVHGSRNWQEFLEQDE